MGAFYPKNSINGAKSCPLSQQLYLKLFQGRGVCHAPPPKFSRKRAPPPLSCLDYTQCKFLSMITFKNTFVDWAVTAGGVATKHLPPPKKKISESALLLRKRALPSLSTLSCEWDTCDVLELVNKQTNNQSLFRRSQGGES